MYIASMPTPAVEAVIAAALHRVFAAAPYAPDSLELWLEITGAAVELLHDPGRVPQSMPVFLVYRQQRTEARYNLEVGSLHITSGPLAGTVHSDLDGAAEEVVHACGSSDLARTDPLPIWRFPHDPDPRATATADPTPARARARTDHDGRDVPGTAIVTPAAD
ncbi:hypothetical protein [Nocardia macrotermitis]|uniref:Uncharacterized protein n=1 Tax=Nocardia macrotermitis TaxID=2585198 RepID=A0A7K0DBM6_9NOCA|nr:hypothetical protein [Nocardia macrotermitis]MQY23019.1 hypothetical protein [Nocardia macrotermitis]